MCSEPQKQGAICAQSSGACLQHINGRRTLKHSPQQDALRLHRLPSSTHALIQTLPTTPTNAILSFSSNATAPIALTHCAPTVSRRSPPRELATSSLRLKRSSVSLVPVRRISSISPAMVVVWEEVRTWVPLLLPVW